jgi:hypothetical protein
MYSDNKIPELPKTPHSCSQDDPATAWLTLEWPENAIPVQKIPALLEA